MFADGARSLLMLFLLGRLAPNTPLSTHTKLLFMLFMLFMQ